MACLFGCQVAVQVDRDRGCAYKAVASPTSGPNCLHRGLQTRGFLRDWSHAPTLPSGRGVSHSCSVAGLWQVGDSVAPSLWLLLWRAP